MAVTLCTALLAAVTALVLAAAPARAQPCPCNHPDDQRTALRTISAIYEAIPLKAEAQNGDEVEPGQAAIRGELEVITFKIEGIWQGAPVRILRVLNRPSNCAVGVRLNQKVLIGIIPILPGEIRALPVLRDMKVGWSTHYCLVDFVNSVQRAGKLAEYLRRDAPLPPP